MKCNSCGGKVTSAMKFCGLCGAPVDHSEEYTEDTVVSPEPKSVIPGFKRYIIPAILVIVLVAAVSIAWNIFKPPKFRQVMNRVTVGYHEEQVVLYSQGKEKAAVYGDLDLIDYSLDQTKAAFIVSDDTDSYYGGTLYIADSSGIKQVADEVSYITMSASGNGVAFVQDVVGDLGTLCLYKNGKTTTISEDVGLGGLITISPDGNTVAYAVLDDIDYEYIGYYFDGENHKLGRDIYPVAVSDGARYLYYMKNGKLYVQKGDNEDSRVNLGDFGSVKAFNKDLSQVIFSNGNGERSYISRKGGEKERLSGRISYILSPVGAMAKGYVLGISSFANTYYITNDDSVYRIDGKFESTKILSNVTDPQLAVDGKTIIYQDYDCIKKLDGSKDKAKGIELVERDVIAFIATYNGDAIYYLTQDDELYYQKGKGNPVLIDDDVYAVDLMGYYTDSSQLFTLYKGNKLFYVKDGELYVSTNGKKGRTVSGIDGTVSEIYSDKWEYLTVHAYDGFETQVYHTSDGENFELVDTF